MIGKYCLLKSILVPFAQVVLLTAIEYLREDEQEKEENKEECQEPISEEEKGPEIKEAWKSPQVKRFKMAFVPMLMVIGKLLLSEQNGYKNYTCVSFRKKSGAVGSPCCFHHLLWDCCKLLL